MVTLVLSQPCEAFDCEESLLSSEQQTSSKYLLATSPVDAGMVESRFFQLAISMSLSPASMVAHTWGWMWGGRVDELYLLMYSPFNLVLPSGKNSIVDPSKSVVGDVDDEDGVGTCSAVSRCGGNGLRCRFPSPSVVGARGILIESGVSTES